VNILNVSQGLMGNGAIHWANISLTISGL